MKLTIENQEIAKQLEQLQAVLEEVKELEGDVFKLVMITPDQLAEAIGCSPAAARQIFNIPDFPVCDYCRPKVAEIGAVRRFFSVPHRKNEE